jgi:pSer/pThr/pTyr-binding forkhead associated (FHA) protein
LGGTVFANLDNATAGMQTKLDHMGARLLLLNEADLRVIELRSPETLIGRSSSADCSLANRGVSSRHAKIEFRPSSNLFFLKDLGSSNGTQVDGVPLDANAPHELSPDSYIRFGTVDALFLQSMDAGFHVVSSERHENAARLLTARGQIPSSVVKKAQEDAAEQGVALGEVLLLGQHVEPREWARSVKDAQVASTLQHLTPVSSKRILFWVAVGLALGFTALMATSSGRALLGIGD